MIWFHFSRRPHSDEAMVQVFIILSGNQYLQWCKNETQRYLEMK